MPGDIEVEIDVEGAERVEKALKKGLAEGLKESGEWMLERGEEVAKDRVITAPRVWRKKLKHGFKKEPTRFPRRDHWKGQLKNTAPNAEANEYGLAPGNSPPVQHIIEWVDDELVPNAAAQAKAKMAHIGNWDPQLQALAVQYSKAKVMAAFQVKGGLEEKGYSGIQFMQAAEIYLETVSRMVIKQKIEKNMQEQLRIYG